MWPPKFTNRKVYSETKRKKNYVDVVSFFPFLYHIKDGEGSADTSHINLPLPLTSIESSGGGSAVHFGATEKQNQSNDRLIIVYKNNLIKTLLPKLKVFRTRKYHPV